MFSRGRKTILSTGLLFSLMAATMAQASEIYAKNGVAINGYDPVAYFTDKKPVKGSEKYTAKYEGVTFRFASAGHKKTFEANPAHYVPQFGGYCAYGTAKGHKASTEPQAFTVVNDKLYLNYNNDVRKLWRADIPGFLVQANKNWPDVKKQPEP